MKEHKSEIILFSLIGTLFSIALLMGIFICINNNRYKAYGIEYKSVSKIVKYNANNCQMTAKKILETVEEQEKDFDAYNNIFHTKKQKDRLFFTFLDNLEYLTDILNYKLELYYDGYTNSSLVKGKTTYIQGIEFKTILDKNGMVDKVEMVNPKINSLKIVYGGEGFYVFEPNITYLSQKYGKNLSKSAVEYIKIKSNEENDIKGLTYYNDGAVNPSFKILTNWIISSENYIIENPKSIFVGKMKNDLNSYLSDFLYQPYNTFDYEGKLYPEAKTALEEFLKRSSPNSKSYQKVLKCYDVIKGNNYKHNETYSQCASSPI